MLAVLIMLSLLIKQKRDEALIKSKKPHLEPLTNQSKPTFCNLSEYEKQRADSMASNSRQSPALQEINGKLRFKNAAVNDNEDSTSSFSERDGDPHERREFERYYEDESDRVGSFRNSVSDRVK